MVEFPVGRVHECMLCRSAMEVEAGEEARVRADIEASAAHGCRGLGCWLLARVLGLGAILMGPEWVQGRSYEDVHVLSAHCAETQPRGHLTAAPQPRYPTCACNR